MNCKNNVSKHKKPKVAMHCHYFLEIAIDFAQDLNDDLNLTKVAGENKILLQIIIMHDLWVFGTVIIFGFPFAATNKAEKLSNP